MLLLCSCSAPPLAEFPPPQAANNSREQSPMRRPITSTTRRDGFPNTEWYMPVSSYLVDFAFWQALYGRWCPAVMSTVSRLMSRFVRDNQQDIGVTTSSLANFGECPKGEVRRIPILGSRVNSLPRGARMMASKDFKGFR